VSQSSEATREPESTSEELARVRALLAREMYGVSCRDILAALAQHSWVLHEPVEDGNLNLTHRIIHLNEALVERYDSLAASEGLLDKLRASLPLFCAELPSRTYLRSLSDINYLVSEMREAGLITIRVHTVHISADSARLGVLPFVTAVSHMICPTDLGRSVLSD
jgi:hypothetical protein